MWLVEEVLGVTRSLLGVYWSMATLIAWTCWKEQPRWRNSVNALINGVEWDRHRSI
jgi:hypothetical protein